MKLYHTYYDKEILKAMWKDAWRKARMVAGTHSQSIAVVQVRGENTYVYVEESVWGGKRVFVDCSCWSNHHQDQSEEGKKEAPRFALILMGKWIGAGELN